MPHIAQMNTAMPTSISPTVHTFQDIRPTPLPVHCARFLPPIDLYRTAIADLDAVALDENGTRDMVSRVAKEFAE